MNEDEIKLKKYKEPITSLENLFKSVNIKGEYEQFRLAPCFMLFSFIDLLRSVAVLDNNHMMTSGSIIIRSMFEILLDFLYCETDRKNLYERFGNYPDVNKVILYNALPDDFKENVNMENNITLKNYNLFKEKYHIRNDWELDKWSGLSVRKRVNIVSKTIPEINSLFLNIYKLTCEYSHPSAETICEYAELINQEIHMNYEKKYNKDRFLLIRQVNSMAEIFYNKFSNTYANKSLMQLEF